MKRCKWHCCYRKFKPRHNRQEFCNKTCSVKHAEWRKTRGSVIVSMILDDKPLREARIAGAQTSLIDEVAKARQKALEDGPKDG